MKITTDCSFLKKTNIFTVTGCQVSSASSIKLMKGSRGTGRLFWKHIFPISMRIEKMLRSSNLFTGDERNLGKIIWLRWSFLWILSNFFTNWKLQTETSNLLKEILLHGCFLRFLNCTNGSKSHKVTGDVGNLC